MLSRKLVQINILIFLICIGLWKIAWGLTPAQRAELAYQEGQRLELAREFQKAEEYDAAIEAYRDFLKYTQNRVLRWKYQTKPPIKRGSGHPFGRRQYSSVVSDGVVYIADENALYALKSKTGGLLWQMALAEASQPVVADGTLYVAEREKGILHALDAKGGAVIWSAELGIKLGRNPIVDGDIVYVWSNTYDWQSKNLPQTKLYALSRTDGTRLWQHDLGARISYLRPVTISECIVYVFSTAEPVWDEKQEYWNWADFCTLSALDGRRRKTVPQPPSVHARSRTIRGCEF